MKSAKSILLFVVFIFLTTALQTIVSGQSVRKNKINKPAKRFEAEIFYKPRKETSFYLSPDGQKIVYIGYKNNQNAVFIRKIGQTPDICLFDSTIVINRFYWSNNDYILYLQDNKGDENYKLYRINIHNREIKCLANYENVRVSIINNPGNKDGNIVIEMNLRDKRIFDPYRLNIITGELEILYKNPGNLNGWMVDNSGVIRFAQSDVLLYRKDNTSEFREIMKLNSAADVFTPKYFAPDNKHVYAFSNINRDKTAIIEFDPETEKEVKVIFEDPEYDAFGDDERDFFNYSESNKKLLYSRYTREKRNYVFFDKKLEKMYDKLKYIIGKEYEIDIISYSDDFTRFILRVSSDKVEGRYYFYNASSEILEKLGEDSPWLDENEMADVKPVSFKARDGLLIHGYLTLPKGVKVQNLPVVINPHAGPQWRNSWIFDLRTQFLANRGYAILQINYRGSMGYGKSFMKAGYKQWGLKMQDDITDGVQWLIKQGIADKKRIAIMGQSAGGYAALAGVTFTPEIYACGIDFNGPVNFFTLYRSFPSYWNMKLINERWGDIVKDSVQMYNTSPVFHVNRIKAPLLIVQGGNDIRVKRGQSDEMVEALRKQNKVVDYILLKDIGHGLPNNELQLRIMKKVEEFLELHLGDFKEKKR